MLASRKVLVFQNTYDSRSANLLMPSYLAHHRRHHYAQICFSLFLLVMSDNVMRLNDFYL